MIRINLAPYEEIENQKWWLPDAICLGLSILTLGAGALYYDHYMTDQINASRTRADQYNSELDSLRPELARFRSAQEKMQEIENKYQALEKLTLSQGTKFLPLIVLEHMQVLKPQGVWLTGVELGRSNNSDTIEANNQENNNQSILEPIMTIRGHAFDHIILAEYMMLLKATMNQEHDSTDLRTQVYFDPVDIRSTTAATLSSSQETSEESIDVISFELSIHLKDRFGSQDISSTASQINVSKSESKVGVF